MSHNTQIIIDQAQRNPELATEIYCELYIYTHYTQDQVGVDVQAYSYQVSEPANDNCWLSNLIYRLSSIFRRRGIHVTIDTNDVKDLIQRHSELGISLA